MNALQTKIQSTLQFRSRPPDYFITNPNKTGGDHEEVLRIPMYDPSTYESLTKDNAIHSSVHLLHSHDQPHLRLHHHVQGLSNHKSNVFTSVKSGKLRPSNTKTIQQFHSYMTTLGVQRDDHDKIGRHLEEAAAEAALDGSSKESKFAHMTFPTKRLVTTHGCSLLTALKGVCHKLEILAVLPQIMSRLTVGDVELEDILGPECTDAILQLLYIQMAWLEYRCPQSELNANFMGKTLHEIKRRLQKGVRAKMTKLKFTNALSVERLEKVKMESVYDIQDNIHKLEQDQNLHTSSPSMISGSEAGKTESQSFIDYDPSDDAKLSCSSTANRHKNDNMLKKRSQKCKKEIQMTEEEKEKLQKFIDGEAERTEQRTNTTMRTLMQQALNTDESVAEKVFHDIFYDTVIQSRPQPRQNKQDDAKRFRKEPQGEKVLEKYGQMHRNKKHRPDCRKCLKDPHRCLIPSQLTAKGMKPRVTVGKRQVRPACLRFARQFDHHVETGGEDYQFDGWGSDYSPLDEYLSDTELDEDEEEAYLDCVKSLTRQIEMKDKVNQELPSGLETHQGEDIKNKRKVIEGELETGIVEEIPTNTTDNNVDKRKISQNKTKLSLLPDDGKKSQLHVGEYPIEAEGQGQDEGSTKESTVANSAREGVRSHPEEIEKLIIITNNQEEIGETEKVDVDQLSIDLKSTSSTSKDDQKHDRVGIIGSDLHSQSSRRTTVELVFEPSEKFIFEKKSIVGQEDHHHVESDDLEFDAQGRLIPSSGIPQSRLSAADPSQSKFLSRLIGIKESKSNHLRLNKNTKRKQALQKKRLYLVKRALRGTYGKYVRKALKEKNVRELLFLIQLDKNNRDDQMGIDAGDEETRQEKEDETRKLKLDKLNVQGIKEKRATWRERWYGNRDRKMNGTNALTKSELEATYGHENDVKVGRGWKLVRESTSHLCLVKQWKNSQGQWHSKKIRLNKHNKPEKMEDRKHRLLKKMNRKLEREKRIKELQNVFGQKIPRIAYEKYDRENSAGQVNSKSLKQRRRDENLSQDCEPPKFRASSDESNSSSEEDGEYRIVVTDPYPFTNPVIKSAQTAIMSSTTSSRRPKTGLAETIRIPEHSESYKLGSIRMLTANYNIGRMAALEMPWIGPELFGVSSDQYNSEQLKAAYREVLRLVCLNDQVLEWITQQIKPEVTQAVKIFYTQIQVLQGLMYSRLLMSPQEEVNRITYLKETWIREQRLLRLHKTLNDELNKLEKEREEMMVTLNESINNFIGQIDHAYLQCHQEIVRTIAEYTKMELVTTKSADHALQELHGTLQKCVTMASIMRAKFSDAENNLQKNEFKLLADLDALISQYDAEMFGRQEILDQFHVDENTNKAELNRLEDKLLKIENRYTMMTEEMKQKQEDGKKKLKKKSKKKKKKRKSKRSRKGKKSRRSKSRGRKGKKKSKKAKSTSDENSSEYEVDEDETEATSAAEGTKPKKVKPKSKSRSRSKSKSPAGRKRSGSKKDSRSIDLASDAEAEVIKKQKDKKKKNGRIVKSGKTLSKANTTGDKMTGEKESGITEEEDETPDIDEDRIRALRSKTANSVRVKGAKDKKDKKGGKKKRKSKSGKSSGKVNGKSSKVAVPKPSKVNGVQVDNDFDEPPTPPESSREKENNDSQRKSRVRLISNAGSEKQLGKQEGPGVVKKKATKVKRRSKNKRKVSKNKPRTKRAKKSPLKK